MDLKLSRAKALKGTVTIPGDKSISHRALMISALAEGESEIDGFLNAADPRSTLDCLQMLGVRATLSDQVVKIQGRGLHGLRAPRGPLDAGNSGTTIRLLCGILAGQSFLTVLSGDESLCRRPMKRVIEPLGRMGAKIDASPSMTPPLKVHGSFPLRPIVHRMEKPSAQVKSAILLAGLFADGTTEVTEKDRTRDHTERMLGLMVTEIGGEYKATVEGGRHIPGQAFVIPRDISSAAFLIAAATLVPHSDITLPRVGVNKTRRKVIDLFKTLGASVDLENEITVAGEAMADLRIRSATLQGVVVLEASDVALLIDEIPVIAVTLALSGLSLSVRGASDLRNKESDRIDAVVTNLRRIGVEVEEYPDGFAFQGKNALIPAVCDSFGDHRIAMAFGIAGLVLNGETVVKGANCVEISFPSFWSILHDLQHT
jgi:3-phosphoshikimate 1-carboxyvinyltransferase